MVLPPAHVLAWWLGLSFWGLSCFTAHIQLGSIFKRLDTMSSYPDTLRNPM